VTRDSDDGRASSSGWLPRALRALQDQRLLLFAALAVCLAFSLQVAPFDLDLWGLPRNPVAVDAIPDLGENQQIVFTEWAGRSPQDIEDQVTYPLSVALLGMPGVRTLRSSSMFGFSIIYLIFEEDIEFYWSRSRVLEKLASLPLGSLPPGVAPALGPDATALGQIFWYTIEGRDRAGNPAGGWDLDELRSVQDFQVRYALQSVPGVSEVASVGGFVREYQVDVDPAALRAFDISLAEVFASLQRANSDVGARTIEVNRVEYLIRGIGRIDSIEDIENTVLRVRGDTPIRVRDVARVAMGPALRRGALDKQGAEAVGGVVIARYGANPLEVIQQVHAKIEEIAPSLPERVLPDGRRSKLRVVPFYDRTQLIHETLGTLESALWLELSITVLVVLVMVRHVTSSLLISASVPIAIGLAFIGMKLAGVDANIVALSGIAIAIGTMVDVSVIVCENIVRRLDEAPPDRSRKDVVAEATAEVGGAVIAAVATTIVSFLPVFALESTEGKLFRPLAFTKTFSLFASVVVGLLVLPAVATSVLRPQTAGRERAPALWLRRAKERLPAPLQRLRKLEVPLGVIALGLLTLAWLLQSWQPLGAERGMLRNALFVSALVGGFLWMFSWLERLYPIFLGHCLRHRRLFLAFPLTSLMLGGFIWIGADRMLGFAPDVVRDTPPMRALARAFPGLGREFMPPLDEGTFLYMPSTMPHASMGEALDVLSKIDRAIGSIPEVETVVGKLGRAETPLDPAPISMMETVVQYRPEYRVNEDGEEVRQWRSEIHSPQDIWNEIIARAQLPGTTSAPRLQPIETRLVMLQSGMRASMGIKVLGPSLEALEQAGLELERVLRTVPEISAPSVYADRIVGKPYLEIRIDRTAIARYGLRIRDVQDVIEVAIGGRPITWTIEGRERYAVRVRYPIELRTRIEDLGEVLVAVPGGAQIPMGELAQIEYVRGPQVIKSENTFLVSYVIFDRIPGVPEVEAVESAQRALAAARDRGRLDLPEGVSFSFTGAYENQLRSTARLSLLLPVTLLVIFLILQLQFRSAVVAGLIFTSIFIAWAGGFILIGLYGTSWFLNFEVFGTNLRDAFGIQPVYLSVAVWVGFIALFGIASDDGVVVSTLLQQVFRERQPTSVEEIHRATVAAGRRRARPMLMTTATTVLALLVVLGSEGRGSELLVPMAIPAFGGMLLALMSQATVPVLFATYEEWKLRHRTDTEASRPTEPPPT